MDMYLGGCSIRSIEGRFSADAELHNHEGTNVQLPGSCLFLKGNFLSLIPKKIHAIEGYHRTQNFKYDPDNDFTHVVPGEKPFHLVHISYSEEYLHQFLPDNERWADDLKLRIYRRERIYGERSVLISEAQERSLQTIFNNPLTGKLGLLMLQTAAIQIILLQLNELFRNCNARHTDRLSRRDLELVHSLKEFLSTSFLEDHSLQSLAQHFGVNTNKLMSVFRKTFGKSIFEFIQELRMQHARKLLLEGDLRITEVARVVGYKNPNHFSAAFKRQFQINPSQFRAIATV